MATDGSAITVSYSGRKSSIKDPAATLDYPFDWSDWLAEVGDTILDATATVDDFGATVPLVIESLTKFAGIVTIFVSGGQVGHFHDLTVHIITTSTPARIDERTLRLKIKER